MARAREFDEDEVLLKAMRLFWEQGYEKTSINDLVEHMGIHRRSLYDTFGDKRRLFLLAVERYGKLLDATVQAGIRRAGSARQALQFLFDYTIAGGDKPQGCLFVNMAVELAPHDAEIDAKAGDSFAVSERLIADLIRQGRAKGEFPASRGAEQLAESMNNSLIGLRVLARTSADKNKLRRIADMSLAALEQ